MILTANVLTRKESCYIQLIQQFVVIKEAFLKSLSEQEHTWHTLPKDAACKGRGRRTVNLSCARIGNLLPVVARFDPGWISISLAHTGGIVF